MVEEPPTSWADLWDVEYAGNVLMFNNSRDAYAIAAKKMGLSDVYKRQVGNGLDRSGTLQILETKTRRKTP